MGLVFTVPPAQDGWCVRDVLRAAGVSLTALRKAKRTPPGLLADGRPVHADARVAAGVLLQLPDVAEASPGIRPQPLPLTVLYEDDAAVMLDKPAGMAVHPTLGHADGTLANAWLGELARRGQTGAFHAVWRLDKDTSGLVLAARTAAAQTFLQRDAKKLYAAVLDGVPAAPAGVVDAPIARAADSIILRQVSADGARAVTRYRVVMQGGGRALAVFWLDTGRTHQIRVHMAHIGCPLAGDDLYGGVKSTAFCRQALHCFAAVFRTPAGVWVRCRSPFPADMLTAAGWQAPAAQRLLDAAADQLLRTDAAADEKDCLTAFFTAENRMLQ